MPRSNSVAFEARRTSSGASWWRSGMNSPSAN